MQPISLLRPVSRRSERNEGPRDVFSNGSRLLEISENSAFIPRARVAAVASQGQHVASQEHAAIQEQRASQQQAASQDVVRVHVIVEDATPVSRQKTNVPKPSPVVREVRSSVPMVTPLLPSDLPGYDLLPVASAEIVLEARALMYRSVAKLLLEEALPMASKDLLVAASCGSSARAGWQLFDLCVIAVQCRAHKEDIHESTRSRVMHRRKG